MRISGGVHRSRQLVSPRGSSTRPTSDRVREALFSILDSRSAIADARVIDFFAGTGALGLEALSRGAARVTFVENDRRALEALARNIDALRERPRTRVVPQAAVKAAATLAGEEATLVFCDPPYADVTRADGVAKLLAALESHRVLHEGARLVLEHATRDRLSLPSGSKLHEEDTREYGDTTLSFYLYTHATP
jgi:16S rRNA (guanine966-N2)-methyltransferase